MKVKLHTLSLNPLPVLRFIPAFVFLLVFAGIQSLAQSERDDIPEKYKWNLQDLYSSDEAWKEAREDLAGKLDKVGQYKGTLTASSENLLSCLQYLSSVSKEAERLYGYAAKKSDQDTRVSKYSAMRQELQQMLTDFSSEAAFIEPEILSMEWSTVEQFINEQEGLNDYKIYLDNLFRKVEHQLSEEEEKILALSGMISENTASVYRTFSNAEMPYPTVVLNDGTEALLDKSGYSKYRAVENRADREKVFDAFWSVHEDFEASFGDMLYGNVKSNIFYARSRDYNSSLERALDVNNIPTGVYHSLIENVNNNLGTFHRYLKLKKRILKVDTLKYSDLYAPVVGGIDLEYSYEEATELLIDAVNPLGEDYVDVVKRAVTERWIDVYPTRGKRSGAYSSGSAYDVHPYILLNYNGRWEDVSTLAHEMGHTMHSYYSNKYQSYPLAGYSIFVAEVASTFNEALLMDKMMNEISDEDARLSLLMSYLDAFKGTLFRQTQFAEYELLIHEKAEQGVALTGDLFTELYGSILKKYYGHEQGICHIDEPVTREWAFIPHFYYNFYVYQYSTSFTASMALAEKVLNEEEGAVEKYIDFISAGGSDYPINVLRKAGVDMTTSEPFDKTMDAMNSVMDEIERILDEQER